MSYLSQERQWGPHAEKQKEENKNYLSPLSEGVFYFGLGIHVSDSLFKFLVIFSHCCAFSCTLFFSHLVYCEKLSILLENYFIGWISIMLLIPCYWTILLLPVFPLLLKKLSNENWYLLPYIKVLEEEFLSLKAFLIVTF